MDFEKLYQTYYMKIYSYVMTLVKNPDWAEEITQEVFCKAFRTRQSFAGRSSEYTWLCAIAKHTACDWCKRHRREESLPAETEDAAQHFTSATTDAPLQAMLERKETVLQLHMELHRMEEPYKEVFQLRIFGELSFAEIGSIFQKSEAWARVTYHRARLKLQHLHQKEG